MSRAIAAGLILLAAGAPAFADQKYSDPMPRYERNGGGFSCRMSAQDFEKSEAAQRDVCMRVGPLSILMNREEVEKVLGAPTTRQKLGDREAFMYALQSDDTRLVVTYVVLTYGAAGRVQSIQLTGNLWAGAWKFCGLTLGDSSEALKGRLGPPKQVETSDDPGAEQWSYRPWEFSFEVKQDRISSIRVAYGDF